MDQATFAGFDVGGIPGLPPPRWGRNDDDFSTVINCRSFLVLFFKKELLPGGARGG
jgi:hypothetical protein